MDNDGAQIKVAPIRMKSMRAKKGKGAETMQLKVIKDLNSDDEESKNDNNDDEITEDFFPEDAKESVLVPDQFNCCECLQYCIFIILFTAATILARSSDSSNYRVTSQIKELLFKEEIDDHGPSFKEIVQEEEMWNYLELILLPRLLTEKVPSGLGTAIVAEEDKYLVNQNCKLLGGIRMRVVRMESKQCLVENDLYPTCYPPNWDGNIDKDKTFSDFSTLSSDVTYSTADANDDHFGWYAIQGTYAGGGYVVDLPMNYATSLSIVQDLRQNGFVDRATRAVIVDFNTYNPTVNFHTVARLGFELPAAGGVIASYDIKSWKLFRYKGNQGTFIAVLEWILVGFVVYFTVEEILEIRRPGAYWQDKWNLVDILNLLFFDATIILRTVYLATRQTNDYNSVNKFISYRDVEYIFKIEVVFQMVNGFILIVKLMKYMTFSKRIRFLFAILHHSAKDLAVFSVVLFILFGAFGFAGFLLFSSDVEEFRTYPHSILNLFRFLVGDIDYESLAESSNIFGSIYYTLWGLVMLMILANVFIAILTDAFTEVKSELAKGDDGPGLFDAVRQSVFKNKHFKNAHERVGGWLAKSRLRHSKSFFREVDKDKDGLITVEELAEASSISRSAAKEVLKSFDKDANGVDIEEFKYMRDATIVKKMIKEEEDDGMKTKANQLELAQSKLMGKYLKSVMKEQREMKKELKEIKKLLETLAGKGDVSINVQSASTRRNSLIASLIS